MEGLTETNEIAPASELDEAAARRLSGVTITPLGNTSPAPANVLGRVDLSGIPAATVEVTLQTLLQAGAHFGHQTSRWHPAMAPFIYGNRNGIHILHLPKTLDLWRAARKVIVDTVANGGQILFVGTKKQAMTSVIEEASRCGAFYVARRWLGGMLTNFQTIRKSIERMKKLETLLTDEEQRRRYTKKELLMMDREREKLEFSLGGIKDMHGAPQILFVIDTKREEIAVQEAERLGVPVVALVDTNCNPTLVSNPIPSNDDATRAIRLFCAAVADAVLEGRAIRAQRGPSLEETKGTSHREGREGHFDDRRGDDRRGSRRNKPRGGSATAATAVAPAVGPAVGSAVVPAAAVETPVASAAAVEGTEGEQQN